MINRYIQPYIFALKYVWEGSKYWSIARFALILLQAILPLLSLYLMKLIIDGIISPQGLNPEVPQETIEYLIYLGLVLLFQAISNTVSQLVADAQEQKVSDYMTGIVQKQALELDLSYFEDPQFHNTHFQAQKEAVFRPVRIVTSLMGVLQNLISLLLLAGFLSFLSPSVGVVLVISILPAIIIKYRYSKKMYNWLKERMAKQRESHYLNFIMGDYHHAKEIRVFNSGAKLRQRYKAIREKLFREKLTIGRIKTINTLIAKVFEVSAEIGVYTFIIYRTIKGTITIGDMVIYYQAFQKGKLNLTNALESFVKLVENKMFLTYIRDFLGFKSRLTQPSNPIDFPESIEDGITLKKVGFRYPEQESPAVRDVSVSFKRGELCAIVGENGSGKSTLLKLLCRLYDPTSGEIMLDNQTLNKYDLQSYQKQLTVTFQDFVKYQFTVEENITLNHKEIEDQEKLAAILQSTGAKEFVDTLPNTFNQKLGKQYNDGLDLSLGQWQKIAIARSMYREANIILMDEPTSAIDPLAEHTIFENLKSQSRDKIVVLITHRLYNLRMADKIIVMDQGTVVETGNHDELINKQGVYAKMFEKQSPQSQKTC